MSKPAPKLTAQTAFADTLNRLAGSLEAQAEAYARGATPEEIAQIILAVLAGPPPADPGRATEPSSQDGGGHA